MQAYLNAPIKEVISKFPKVADILNGFDIGCVPCSVGTCLLKDVVAIHNIGEENKAQLMFEVEKDIYPDREVKRPVINKAAKAKPEILRYSPPLRMLVNEHLLIKRLLNCVPAIVKALKEDTVIDKEPVIGAVDFIRMYADKFHHAKEEDILFKYFDEKADIIQAMLNDHVEGRSHVKEVLNGLKDNKIDAVSQHLSAYAELLTGHIKKEDEILYPWMDKNLTVKQVGELFDKFNAVDNGLQRGVEETYKGRIEDLEAKFIQK